jgi:hypothetical protein
VIPGVRRTFHIRAGIVDAGYTWHTDLKQTKFLTIRMQAICLSIDGDTIDRGSLLKQLG